MSLPVPCCRPLSGPPLSDAEADQTAQMFKALADPVRLRMLSALLRSEQGEVCACAFVDIVGKSQPTVSHHLKALREAGLVTGERRGTWVWYRAATAAIAALRAALDVTSRSADLAGSTTG